jgi:hypothetical protein
MRVGAGSFGGAGANASSRRGEIAGKATEGEGSASGAIYVDTRRLMRYQAAA